MGLYLKVANPGVAPVEGFLMLGVSTTRLAGSSGTIGQFGSGSKHAINLCLRNHINPVVFCGLTKMEFFTERMKVDDGLSTNDFGRICCALSGKLADGSSVKRTEKTSLTTEHGVQDWVSLDMALREFVANALDRTFRETGGYENVTVEIVSDNQVRASKDETRIFIPVNEEVQKFYNELPKRFLHFREKHLLNTRILAKRDRNITGRGPVIYKKGVLVRELHGVESLFDYNFGEELTLDECRNSDIYTIKAMISRTIGRAEKEMVSAFIRDIVENEGKSYEAENLDPYYARLSNDNESQRKVWQESWKKAVGEAVACSDSMASAAVLAERKGHKVKIIKSSVYDIIDSYGVTGVNTVVNEEEAKGKEILPPNEIVEECLDDVWNYLSLLNLTMGKDKPKVALFNDIMSGNVVTNGFYKHNCCYILQTIATEKNDHLWKVMMEEVAHYITGATDNSRDFQDFAFRVITESRKLV